MKKIIRISTLILFGALCFIQNVKAQETTATKTISDRVAQKDFVFTAEAASPLSGKQRILTSQYDVRLTKDSIISYLPYFGETHMAPVTTEESGIMFTSTKFEYSAKPGKKKTWEVEIKFTDQRNTQKFNFTIYDDGGAYLNVTSNFRDPISFRGSINAKR